MTLKDKLKFWLALNNYIEMIVHDTSLLSLPNAMEDSLDYLKAFGGTEQRNIPAEYTQLEYIESTGTQYIDLGYPIDSTRSFHLKSRCLNTGFVFGSRTTNNTNVSSFNYDSVDNLFGIRMGNTILYKSTNWTENTDYEIYISDGDTKINGTTVSTTAYGTSFYSGNAYLFTLNNNGVPGSSKFSINRIYYFQMLKNGVLTQNLIPCRRNSDNVLGMYDTVSGTFFTNAGTGTFTAGPNAVPTPDTPMDIYCNNGALKVNLNLYWAEYHGYELSQVDGITTKENGGVNVSGMVDCRTIKSFKITTVSPQGSFRIFRYRADSTFINAAATANIGDIITFEDNVGFFRIQYNHTNIGVDTENVLIYNSAYNLNGIYTDGTVETIKDSLNNTATTEMLLKVGNYQDVQSIIDGVITRNIGVKVLDGTENWIATGISYYVKVPGLQGGTSRVGLSTHFPCTNNASVNAGYFAFGGAGTTNGNILFGAANDYPIIQDWKQFLADQYAAGTPVIVVYPLKTPTTESVAGQALQVTEGNNIAEITQASLDNLELEAKYNSVP